MSIRVASRHNWDIDGLIKEIEQPQVKAVIYFFSLELERFEPHKAIKRAFPSAACIGASMCGGWCTTGASEKGIIAMSLSSDEVEETFIALQEGVKSDPLLAAQQIIADLKRQIGYRTIFPNTYLGLVFFDGLCHGEVLIKRFTFEKGFNLNLVGGAAADEFAFEKTLVSANEKCSADGVVLMVMKMKIPFFCNHYVHCLPTTTSFMITKADPINRIIWEIDGQNAAEYYAKIVGVSGMDKLTASHLGKNPLGIVLGDTIYVRAVDKVIDGPALKINCSLEEGTKATLLRCGDIIGQAYTALEEVKRQYLTAIQGALLFNCALRYLELQELNQVAEFNRVFQNIAFAGFNTFGEEYFTHHNQTLTAVFFGG
ncbi:MAG: FIST C-terminal domain-containing protein [Spirochaetaceae bacterium]|jgi:hypothetical protein|nr:FIST C-terminal domain-containing protein [Spirochaetaceae bacterium]